MVFQPGFPFIGELNAQGAYRMRGINKGQRLVVYAIPEATDATVGMAWDLFASIYQHLSGWWFGTFFIIFYFSIYWESSSQLTFIFFRWVCLTTNQISTTSRIIKIIYQLHQPKKNQLEYHINMHSVYSMGVSQRFFKGQVSLVHLRAGVETHREVIDGRAHFQRQQADWSVKKTRPSGNIAVYSGL